MIRGLQELRAASDDQLIAEHDQRAVHTEVGTQYYADELQRREQLRAIEAANALARRTFWLTVANTFLAAGATLAAIVALFR